MSSDLKFQFNNINHATDVMNYCRNNFDLNDWDRLCDSFVFRKEQDAEWFMLRWS